MNLELGGKTYELHIRGDALLELMRRHGPVLSPFGARWDFTNADILCDVISVGIRDQVDKRINAEWVAKRLDWTKLYEIGPGVMKVVYRSIGIKPDDEKAPTDEGNTDPEA